MLLFVLVKFFEKKNSKKIVLKNRIQTIFLNITWEKIHINHKKYLHLHLLIKFVEYIY